MSADASRVIDVYERHTHAWVAARRQEHFYERGWLDPFCALIPSGGTVLDIGCGAGEPIAKYLSGRGYGVTGIDSSSAMIAMFKQCLPEAPAVIADMRELSIDRRFDGIIAWDSFFHLSREDQRQVFAVFQAHAAPRAALLFTSGPANGEVIGNLEGEKLYHASLDPAAYRRLLGDMGFVVVAHAVEDQSCGGRTVWLAQSK